MKISLNITGMQGGRREGDTWDAADGEEGQQKAEAQAGPGEEVMMRSMRRTGQRDRYENQAAPPSLLSITSLALGIQVKLRCMAHVWGSPPLPTVRRDDQVQG